MTKKASLKDQQELRERLIGKRYNGILHFLFTSSVCLTIIVAALFQIHNPSWTELLTVPLTFLYANFAEYRGHRGPMHHRMKYLSLIFKRHTLQHHRFFTHETMEAANSRDFKMVLFPPVLIVFFFGLFALPVGALLGYLTTMNVAYLFVATGIGYFLNYEWLHLSYHLPETSKIAHLPFLRALRRHHQLHHDPALMSQYHFNITYPICDFVFETLLKKKEELSTPHG